MAARAQVKFGDIFSAATAQDGNVHVLNMQTGVTVCVFKGATVGAKGGMMCVGKDFICCSHGTKALLHTFHWGKVTEQNNTHKSIDQCSVIYVAYLHKQSAF
jgi:hypothetical protein